jgi:hypothetical protein
MNKEELRIGNYVGYNKEILCIKEINTLNQNKWINGFIVSDTKSGNGKTAIWAIQPIPLTEDVLLNIKHSYIYEGWDSMKFFRFEPFHIQMFELEILEDGFYYEDAKIEFVHDLQNCYYFHANQKKELEINL